MKTNIENHQRVRHEDIAQLAKQLWEREGRQAGRDLEYWLRAERQLLSDRKPTPSANLGTGFKNRSQGRGRAFKLPDSLSTPPRG